MFAAVSKRNIHLVALKYRLNMWTLAHFYYIDIGTYCCVFIALLQKRIAAVQNSNIQDLSLKVKLMLYHALHQTQPDSVNKCKTDVKTYLLMQPCHFNLLVCRFEVLCRTLITQDSYRSSSPPKYIFRTPWATEQTYRLWKPIDMKLDMCDANVQKHQFSNLPAF